MKLDDYDKKTIGEIVERLRKQVKELGHKDAEDGIYIITALKFYEQHIENILTKKRENVI